MDSFTRNDLMQLLAEGPGPCISIYFETARGGADAVQDHARFRGLVREAEQELVQLGLPALETERRVNTLLSSLEDREFWSNTSDGVAVFSRPDRVMAFRVAMTFANRSFVGNRFHIVPLIPIVADGPRFYLLALSMNRVRLFAGDRQGLRQLHVKDMPTSLEDALRYDDVQTQVLYRSTTSHGAAPYAGHGAAIEERRANVDRLVQPIVRATEGLIRENRLPIVAAGVERLVAEVGKLGTGLPLVPLAIQGNPDHLEETELHRLALKRLAPALDDELGRLLESFANRDGTGLASSLLGDILRAAEEGRIRTLLIEEGRECWGSIDPSTRTVTVHTEAMSGDEELLERAAAATFAHRGDVRLVPRKGLGNLPIAGSPVAAIYRY